MSTLIQFRRGTSTQWTTEDHVLADGEPGFEKGTRKLKIGDGVTPWSALPYLVGEGGGGGGGGTGDVTQAELDAAVAAEADARTAADDALAAEIDAVEVTANAALPAAEKGVANGVASLGADGKVPGAQLPTLSAQTTKVELANVALGAEQPAQQADYVWTEVPDVVARGLMTKIIVTPSVPGGPDTLYDVELRDAAAGGGELFLQATGVANQNYEMTVPIYIEGDDTTRSIWIGVRNRSNYAVTFVLTALRVERFA